MTLYRKALILMTACILAGCSTSASSASPVSSQTSAELSTSDVVMDLALSQHTTRSFTDQQISEDDLQKLLKVAFGGATSGGQQARQIIVVNDREVMKKIQAVHVYAQSLDTAPVVLVIAGDQSAAAYPGNLSQDTSIAAQNVVLTAESLGIASNIMSIYPVESRMTGIQEALDLPDTVVPYIMVSLGYAQSEDSQSAASSLTSNYDSMIHYNSWD